VNFNRNSIIKNHETIWEKLMHSTGFFNAYQQFRPLEV